MNEIIQIAAHSWRVLGQMAPYLLFGFLMAGFLSVFISPKFVEKHLGRHGFPQVLKAAAFGVPLPLCSCSVLPVAMSLRQHGAGKGATVSFLASTPQTGVDSIAATWGVLGPLIAFFRVVTALLSGVVSGWLTDTVVPACEEKLKKSDGCSCHNKSGGNRVGRALRYGFITLPRDIGKALLVGILIAGIASALVPADFFAGRLGSGFTAMLVVMLAGIPLYICSIGSIPIALALMGMGLSPGAALVFMVTGPATNAASITTAWKILGKGATIIYLVSVAVIAMGMGFLLDLVWDPSVGAASENGVHMMRMGAWDQGMAIALLCVLLVALGFPSLEKVSNAWKNRK